MDIIINERLIDLTIKPFKIFVGQKTIKSFHGILCCHIKNKEALHIQMNSKKKSYRRV